MDKKKAIGGFVKHEERLNHRDRLKSLHDKLKNGDTSTLMKKEEKKEKPSILKKKRKKKNDEDKTKI